MDHNVVFPIYARLADGQVIRIESFQKILYHLEAIDIVGDKSPLHSPTKRCRSLQELSAIRKLARSGLWRDLPEQDFWSLGPF